MSSLTETEAPVVQELASVPTMREPLTRREQKQAYENNKLFKRLARQVGEASPTTT
jgi:tRNA 2-thiocytidine biosynthesis protein TtcA